MERHRGGTQECEREEVVGRLLLALVGILAVCNQQSVLQGEEKDSSDEEWAAAYVAMDPISQLGWRNRRGVAEGPAEQLMRDVLEAADGVHSEAMSEMVASRNIEDDWPMNADDIVGERMARDRRGSRSPSVSVEVNQEGRAHVQYCKPQSAFACKVACVHGLHMCCRTACSGGSGAVQTGKGKKLNSMLVGMNCSYYRGKPLGIRE